MEVRCDQCSTRYEIPDEKIRGRKVRMPCRRCGTSIIIDARRDAGPKPSRPSGKAPPSTPPPKPAKAETGPVGSDPDDRWRVSVDGTPKEMTVRQIAADYRVGAIPRSSYVWRKGMTDWVFLTDAPELREGLDRLGVDLDETQMSMARLADIAAMRKGPSSRPPPSEKGAESKPTPKKADPSPAKTDEPSASRGRAEATVAAPARSDAAAAPADRGPSVVVEDSDSDVEGVDEEPAASAPALAKPKPVPLAIARKPTVRMKRPPLPPIRKTKKKAKAPIGTILLVVVIAIAAGIAGYYLSSNLGGDAPARPSGATAPAHPVLAPAPPPALPPGDVATSVTPDVPRSRADAPAPGGPFDAGAAERALDRAAAAAIARCPPPASAGGHALVWLKFLPNGRAAGVSLRGTLSETDAGRCIIRHFSRAAVPPFTGEPVGVKRDVSLG